MATIEEFLAKTNLPDAALKPIRDKVQEAIDLILENNKRVAQVNAAKAQDPNNPEYLDTLWRTHAPTDEKMAEVESKYQALVDESEKLLKQLREFGKSKIEAPLSEEEVAKTKKLVNESAPTISTARAAAASMLEIPQSILSAMQVEIPEGGLVTLLPQADSLKSLRGRKASTAAGEVRPNMTRVKEVLIDGVSTNKDGKGKFAYAADALSNKLGVSVHPENKVTPETLEEAYWNAMGKPLRSESSTMLPDEFTFEFEKVTKKQNPNDDSFTDVPVKVKITVKNGKREETPAENKTEEKKTEVPAQAEKKTVPAKTETAKTETAKK